MCSLSLGAINQSDHKQSLRVEGGRIGSVRRPPGTLDGAVSLVKSIRLRGIKDRFLTPTPLVLEERESEQKFSSSAGPELFARPLSPGAWHQALPYPQEQFL